MPATFVFKEKALQCSGLCRARGLRPAKPQNSDSVCLYTYISSDVNSEMAVTQAAGKQELRLAASYWRVTLAGSTGCWWGGGAAQGLVGDQSRSPRRSRSPALGTSWPASPLPTILSDHLCHPKNQNHFQLDQYNPHMGGTFLTSR